MLIQWMKTEPKRTIEILLYLHYLGMANADQLGALLGVSRSAIPPYILSLNKSYTEAVLSHRPPTRSNRAIRLDRPRDPHMYSLGVAGKRIVEEYLQSPISYYQNKGTQNAHYWGVNQLLVEFIQSMGHVEAMERLQWFNNKDARKIIREQWERSDHDEEKKAEAIKNMIIPDSYFFIDDQGYPYEFDNDSEDKKLDIQPKYRKYIATMVPINNDDPVIWVAPTQKRRDDLELWWEEVQQEPVYQKFAKSEHFFFPEMHFFTANEVPEIANYLTKKKEILS